MSRSTIALLLLVGSIVVLGVSRLGVTSPPGFSPAESWIPARLDTMTHALEVRTHPWHNLDHHGPEGGFQNIWPPYRGGSVWKGMTWFLGRAFRGKENRLPPVRPIRTDDLLAVPDSIHFTWIGHATMLIRTPDRSILLDPMFSDRASPFTFAGPEREPDLPIRLADLPEVDVVILSHDHYDHLDERTIELITRTQNPVFLAPLGLRKYLEGWGAERVIGMDWWQYVDIDGIRYHCLPAKHFSGRSLLDRDDTLWAGWYLESLENDTDVFYAGDTGYGPHFGQIRERIGRPDVSILPIGAYLPSWLMQPVHVNPEEAADAFADLEAEHFLPVHWGTFDLADEPLHAPVDTLRRVIRERNLAERVHILDIGETWVYGRSTGARTPGERTSP